MVERIAKTAGMPAEHPQFSPWIVAVAVMFSTFMEVLDTTVVNVSLPHIAGSLSASVEEATWVLTSYLVANAVILPLTGWLANHFGRKRLLMMSVTGFTVASFFCGLAPSLPILILCRVLQGAAGGALQPLSQAVLLEAFPAEQRAKGMAFWSLGIVVAPILGPVLGGWLTDTYSWRWVFYINIPVGIVSLLMTRAYVFDPHYIRRSENRVDWWGIGMLAVGIGALQILLDKGQQEDWLESNFICALLLVALVGLAAFVLWELRVKAPVVDLRVFLNRTFAAGSFLMTMVGFILFGSLVLLPIWLQTLLGYPALQAGMAMAPRGLGSFLAMPVVGLLLTKRDPRKFLAVGMIVASVTMLRFSQLNLGAGYWDFFWPQLIQGASLALLFVPLTTITMGNISREQMGNATSLFNLLRNIGGSIGIATVTTLMSRWQQAHINRLGEHVTRFDTRTWLWLRGLSHALGSSEKGYGALFGIVQRQAALLSFLDVFRLLGIGFLLLVPLVLLTRRPPRGSKAPAGH